MFILSMNTACTRLRPICQLSESTFYDNIKVYHLKPFSELSCALLYCKTIDIMQSDFGEFRVLYLSSALV